jgi:hypothetical protein
VNGYGVMGSKRVIRLWVYRFMVEKRLLGYRVIGLWLEGL